MNVEISTSMGKFTVELYEKEAPISVANFLRYADEGYFDGTIFHRVIEDFMIQCGGMNADMVPKPGHDSIKNEADNGLKNDMYTLAMARTSEIDSATSQFFINTADNAFLDHGTRDFGYAVFGCVTDGTDVVDEIGGVATHRISGHQDVPIQPILIESVRRAD
jgi:peptidyl-prolyl cis-trans isomerase A (cyclophilin A)